MIFKEAITNTIRHSNGTAVEIILGNKGAAFEMMIKDNGFFQLNERKTSGLGLSNMKMRAERMGGTLEVIQKDGFAVLLRRPALE